MVNNNVVNIFTLNVCGLIRRIQYPEFLEFINNYEILDFYGKKTDNIYEID